MKKHTPPTTITTTTARPRLQLGRTTMRELTQDALATVEGAKFFESRIQTCWP